MGGLRVLSDIDAREPRLSEVEISSCGRRFWKELPVAELNRVLIDLVASGVH